MSTKYRGLPDIDTAPDVFETPDEPEGLLRPSDNGYSDDDMPSRPTSEAIDVGGLPKRREAQRVFGRGTKRLGVDSKPSFRPRLPALSRHSSTSSDSDETPLPLPRESAAARIRRLKAELEEVERELQAEGSGSSSAPLPSASQVEGKRRSVLPPRRVDVVSELAGLRERLEKVDLDVDESGHVNEVSGRLRGNEDKSGGEDEWKERLGRLISAGSGSGSGRQDGQNGQDMGEGTSGGYARGPQDGQLSEIDKRLAVLEDLVGPIGDGLDQNTSAPLLATLNKHDHLLSLLTQPRHLDAISRRIKLLLVDLDRAATASRRPGPNATSATQPSDPTKISSLTLSQAEYNTLQTLFSLLPRLDPLLPILSPLLARLRSLSTLHSEASEVASALRKLQGDDKRSSEEVKELLEVVEGVQKGLGEAAGGVARNWESLQGRIGSLEKRLQDLES